MLPLAIIEVVGTLDSPHMWRGLVLAVVAAGAAGAAGLGSERVRKLVPSATLLLVLALTPPLPSFALSWAAALAGTAAFIAFQLDADFRLRWRLAMLIAWPFAIVSVSGLLLPDLIDVRAPIVLLLMTPAYFLPAAIAFGFRTGGAAQ